MAIRGLTDGTVTAFQGKNTLQNLSDGNAATMLSAKNVLILADQQVRRMPGYALLKATGLGPVRAIYDFERSVDQKQFVLAHVGSSLVAMGADGSGLQILSSAESVTPFQFVASSFICYMSNGENAYRLVDNAGKLTLWKWGIAAPAAAPSIAVSAGTLTLTYGRRYVYCEVSKYTDSLGIQRVSVGAPSPYSAHTGPVTNGVPTLSNMTQSTDPQVGYKWIFATSDSPFDTSSTYYFAAEIPDSQTTWGDTLPDVSLDDTRLAPFDNNPAPPSSLLSTFQNRVWATQTSQIRVSGYADTPLGIPQENWPLDLFFNIPSGSRLATGQIVTSDGSQFLVGTSDAWFDYTGYDATTFTEQDRVATPGPAGPLASCLTPLGIVWFSLSKRLWMWIGAEGVKPQAISDSIAQSFPGTLGMEDIAFPATVRLHWYSYGREHFLILFASTTGDPNSLDWMQVWSVDIKGSQLSYVGTQIGGAYQTDKFPNDLVTATANAELAGVPTVLMGDAAGNIYTFPSGFTDNGVGYQSVFSTAWTNCGYDGKKRFYFVDFVMDTSLDLEAAGNALQTMKVWAAVADAPDPMMSTPGRTLNPIPLDLQVVPSPEGGSAYAVRANLQVEGVNTGRVIRLWVELPDVVADDQVLLRMVAWFVPKWQGLP